MRKYLRLLCLVFIGFATNAAAKGVVINELMYHAPNELESLEYIELYNSDEVLIDLSGWAFTNGIRYTFPGGTKIEPNAYIIVCLDLEVFQAHYGEEINALGNFKGSLSNSGERVTLSDKRGKRIDSVKYGDRPPWPSGADGYSSSLERISPSVKSKASNWASSPLPLDERRPAGTPGRQNASYSANLPPVISKVKFSPNTPMPNQSVTVQAKVADKDGLDEVTLLYRIAKSASEGEEMQIPMKRISGDKKSGRYEAIIPGQPNRLLVRFRIKATDSRSTTRFQPALYEPRPTYSYFTYANTETAMIPFGFIVHIDEEEYQAAQRARNRPNDGGWSEEDRRRWMAEEMLRQGTNLEASWQHHTLEQELDMAQIRKLREIYRDKFDAREKWLTDALASENLAEDMKGFPAEIQAFNAGIFETLKAVLTSEQHAEFARWHKQNALSSAMRGMGRWGPERFIKRFVNLEASWFFQMITLDLNDSQFADLKSVYIEAFNARRELINIAKEIDEEDDEKRDEFFGKAWGLNESLSEKSESILTDDQYKKFSEWQTENSRFGGGRSGPKPPPPPRGKSAFIYMSPDAKTYQTYDYINVTPRNGGYKVRFHKDQPLRLKASEKLTTINLLFEYMPRFALAEPLAYEVYRRAGVPTPLTEHIRLWIDEDVVGYHLLVEQPNRAFLRRNKRDDSGNLYKILWYERGVVKQHEKKTNLHTGHDDVANLVDSLNQTEGEAQWELIQRHFNVEEFTSYFAVNMCLSNWDGFFNNYFTYHDYNGSGKWEIYPWDEDKAWGFYDAIKPGKVFYDMPLTFGMNGDIPPGMEQLPEDGRQVWGRPGIPSWWRPGGYFSGPLLANSHFRKHFLARLKEVTETVYTEEVFLPIIDQIAKRLEPEVRIRAQATNQDVDAMLKTFHDDIESLRQHLTKRRNYILAQAEIKAVEKSK